MRASLGSGARAAAGAGFGDAHAAPLPHLPEKLQAFLANYLDPETNDLKYLRQLVG